MAKGRITMGADFFHGGQCNMLPASEEHCGRLSYCYCRLNDPFCCLHRSRDWLWNAF